ncbi:MAG: hypothetical protein GZ088_13115 [Acidipila sp.]|nr:hypothetical protein [Acidipila sp.]
MSPNVSKKPTHAAFWLAALSLAGFLVIVYASAVAPESLPEIRMTPGEMQDSPVDSNQIGSSGVKGVHTKILFGSPEKAGFYAILLFVPAHTTIQAHSHSDDRMATVVSGVWHFGYGDHFDAGALKALPPGSVYSEPGRHNHFAQTEAEAVVVQVCGYGPTGTRYFDPANDPRGHDRK